MPVLTGAGATVRRPGCEATAGETHRRYAPNAKGSPITMPWANDRYAPLKIRRHAVVSTVVSNQAREPDAAPRGALDS
jgi:hypothetical protein